MVVGTVVVGTVVVVGATVVVAVCAVVDVTVDDWLLTTEAPGVVALKSAAIEPLPFPAGANVPLTSVSDDTRKYPLGTV